MSLKTKSIEVSAAERRLSERFVLTDENEVVVIAGARSYHGWIEDISRGGMRLRMQETPPLATELVIEHISSGFFRARKIWNDDRHMAISFEESTTELAHTLRCVRLLMGGGDKVETGS